MLVHIMAIYEAKAKDKLYLDEIIELSNHLKFDKHDDIEMVECQVLEDHVHVLFENDKPEAVHGLLDCLAAHAESYGMVMNSNVGVTIIPPHQKEVVRVFLKHNDEYHDVPEHTARYEFDNVWCPSISTMGFAPPSSEDVKAVAGHIRPN